MTSVAINQLTLDFQPTLPERFPTLREYLAYRAQSLEKPQKTIAADMDMSPSMLSRKLNPGEGDTQRFNLDDLENYIKATGDAGAVVEYLAAKYMDSDEAKQRRAITEALNLMQRLSGILPQLQGVKS